MKYLMSVKENVTNTLIGKVYVRASPALLEQKHINPSELGGYQFTGGNTSRCGGFHAGGGSNVQ